MTQNPVSQLISLSNQSQTPSQPATTSLTGYQAPPKCHEGNVLLIKGEKGGGLYFGGLSRGVSTTGYIAIDLTGHHVIDAPTPVKAMNEAAAELFATSLGLAGRPDAAKAFLRLPIKDYGVPYYLSKEYWVALADEIRELILHGEKVVVFCQGGHGRTGMVASILCHHLNAEAVGDDPVKWVRERYCEKAVETNDQHKYVHTMLGLPEPKLPEKSSAYYGYGMYFDDADYDLVGGKVSGQKLVDQIADELKSYGLWRKKDGDVVLAKRSFGGQVQTVRLAALHDKSDYLTDTGEIIRGRDLLSKAEIRQLETQHE